MGTVGVCVVIELACDSHRRGAGSNHLHFLGPLWNKGEAFSAMIIVFVNFKFVARPFAHERCAMVDQADFEPKYTNDRWTVDDDLEMGHTGDELARLVLEVATPFAVRVTGKWGAGKTSVLRRAFATLGGNPIVQSVPLGADRPEVRKDHNWYKLGAKLRWQELGWSEDLRDLNQGCLPIWFSPWHHQKAGHPLVPLLLEIKAQFTSLVSLKDDVKTNWRRALMAGASLVEHAIDAAATLTFQKNISIVRGMTQAAKQGWDDAGPNLSELGDGQRFHLSFEDAVEGVLESIAQINDVDKRFNQQTRLIVFIDDLDRCEESVVIEMLECIKLYLDTNRCVFVFGIDNEAVLGCLDRHWQGRGEAFNREYLEKLFQATVAVPQPKPSGLQALLAKQLADHDYPNPKDNACHIRKLIEPNPRKVKNFANSLCSNWRLVVCAVKANPELAEETDCADLAVRFLLYFYLRLFHPQVWRILERRPRALIQLRGVLVGQDVAESRVAEEAMVRHLFTRAFFHVLSQQDGEEAVDDFSKATHRGIPLDTAVDRFLLRVDQKRSDTYFLELFRTHIKAKHLQVDAEVLHLGPYEEADT